MVCFITLAQNRHCPVMGTKQNILKNKSINCRSVNNEILPSKGRQLIDGPIGLAHIYTLGSQEYYTV